MRAIWTTRQWAEAIAEHSSEPPLRPRTVLVPREKVAHALRRELLRIGRADLLAGTRFVTPILAAFEILSEHGECFSAYEEQLRPLRLRAIISNRPGLEYFDRDILQTAPGWDAALARTIHDLEAALLEPVMLESQGPRSRDVARLWSASQDSAGESWSKPRLFKEAAALLEATESAWPYDGPTLIATTAYDSAALVRFYRAIPRTTLLIHASARRSPRDDERLRTLFGPTSLKQGMPPARNALQVSVERFGGVEDELRAMTAWVVREVVDHRTPLEDLAILVPRRDPWCSLVEYQLQTLPWPADETPVCVAGGTPVHGGSEGARVLLVVRALARLLDPESLAALLPILRADEGSERPRPSPSEAIELIYSLGTRGGSLGSQGSCDWPAALRRREQRLRSKGPTGPHESRQLALIETVLPAIEQLVDVQNLVIKNVSAPGIWRQLRSVLAAIMPLGSRVLPSIDRELRFLFDDPVSAALRGQAALELIEDVVLRMRTPLRRFGTPSIFVGTVEDAFGLCFKSARFLGMAEGFVPPSPIEDAVLPSSERRLLGPLLVQPADVPASMLFALERVVRDTAERACFSRPAVDFAGVAREGSAALLDLIPTVAEETTPRNTLPVSEASWLDGVARGAWGLKRSHARSDLGRADQLSLSAAGPMHGFLGARADLQLPGLSAERPISLSKLRTLFQCPYKFLLEEVLRFRAPSRARSGQDPDALAYGNALHAAAEHLFEQSWSEVVAEPRPDARRAAIDRAVDFAFERELDDWPFSGDAQRLRVRAKLGGDLERLLEHDLRSLTRDDQIRVERSFGEEEAVEVSTAAGSLFLRGRIDRIETRSRGVWLRDLKTGRARPRRGPPEVLHDVQIAGYVAAVRSLDQSPIRGAGYLFLGPHGVVERNFDEDLELLERAWSEWSALALDLLRAAEMPRTPVSSDCAFCEMKPICGERVAERSAAHTSPDSRPAARFRDLRIGSEAGDV